MKILAIDTSGIIAAVAVLDESKLLAEYILNHKKTHSVKLMPMIKEIISNLDLTLSEIDVFAASNGPGSFTGLRIGITTIKSMAYALKKPVISVPTLDALANNINKTDNLICPIIDARNNQVFTALYEWKDKKLIKITDYMGIDIKELVNIIKQYNRKTIFLGDGIFLHEEYLFDELLQNFEKASIHLMLQKASSVAEIARRIALEGKFEDPFDMVPFYLRKSQAERLFKNDNK